MKFPFNGRGTHLGERLLFQFLSRTYNHCSFLPRDLSGMGVGSPGTLLIPLGLAGLVSLQPFKKPSLRAVKLGVDLLWRRLLQVFHDGSLSDLFFHAIASSAVMATIITRKRVSGARCIGTKNGIKGNRCIGTPGCTMYWQLSRSQKLLAGGLTMVSARWVGKFIAKQKN